MKFYHEILDKLRNGVPYKFSRWGDGEWGCMYGVTGENRDGNEYLPELGVSLRGILNSEPKYYMGLQYGVLYNERLRDYVFGKIFKLDINWVNGDILHQASEYGHLKEFVNALKSNCNRIIYIGADYFKELSFIDVHIKTPDANSFNHNDDIMKEIEVYVPDPKRCIVGSVTGSLPMEVYLVSAAMNSNVIIDKLPDNVTAIDIGSVFDPYLGRPRASYQHKMNVKFNDLW